MESLKPYLAWLLWLWMVLVILGAFFYAPAGAGFMGGESSRILFFHVPMAWTAFLAFYAAAFWSLRYLAAGRRARDDRAAAAAVELGLLFGILATVTGSLWARVEWHSFWNWDPRQTSIVLALIFYGAYLALRDAVEDDEKRARLAAAYALLGVVVTPFFFFIVPRITYSLHPEPVINSKMKIEMELHMREVLLSSTAGFTALFFWLHNLTTRLRALAERRAALAGEEAR